jgi:YecR-like lipoprotein/PDZ domain
VRFTLMSIAAAAALAGCATQETMIMTGGSRADGTVKLSYEAGGLEQPVVNEEQGRELAERKCAVWGYAGAESFGSTTWVCEVRGAFGSCARRLVSEQYQCTGEQAAGSGPSARLSSDASAGATRGAVPATNKAPTSVAQAAASQAVAASTAGHVRLGVHCSQLPPEFARKYHLPRATGVQVATIEAGSVADAGGIRVGDVLLKYGDQPLSQISDLMAAIAGTAKGADVPITVWRQAGGESVLEVQF